MGQFGKSQMTHTLTMERVRCSGPENNKGPAWDPHQLLAEEASVFACQHCKTAGVRVSHSGSTLSMLGETSEFSAWKSLVS